MRLRQKWNTDGSGFLGSTAPAPLSNHRLSEEQQADHQRERETEGVAKERERFEKRGRERERGR